MIKLILPLLVTLTTILAQEAEEMIFQLSPKKILVFLPSLIKWILLSPHRMEK